MSSLAPLVIGTPASLPWTAGTHAGAGTMCPPPHLSSIELGPKAAGSRAAHAAFFLTGRAQFWGSAFHLEFFIDAIKAAADKASSTAPAEKTNGTVLVDVGAAPYNVVGGDISHILTYLKNWPAASGATIMGFEPGSAPFSRLVQYVGTAVGPEYVKNKESANDAHTNTPSVIFRDAAADNREWIVLRNTPASDRNEKVRIMNQPQAGDNTASLEKHYQSGHGPGRTVRSVTLDGELRRRGLGGREVLVLKVDVEGHEMAVLRGAMKAISAGLVPIILVEYGDKMSPVRHLPRSPQISPDLPRSSPIP